jgi:PAS domain S-box-containing protein
MGAARSGRDVDYVVRLQMPDGSIKYVREFGHGIRNEAGRPELIGSVQDVTESKMAEASLTAGEAELRRAYDYLTEAQKLSRTGSFTWDVFADEHNWSDEIRRIFGFRPDVQVTMGMIQAAVHPDDVAEVGRVIGGAAEGRDFDLTFRILTTDGEVRHAHVVGHRIAHITDRTLFLGALQDVTDRKVAEERLDRARSELARVSRITALSALTASIAHEVNQPLAGIITNASTCLRLLAADPPNIEGAQATAQRTIRDANRASEVIKRLRALFARRPPASEPLDLNHTAREVLTLASSELDGARVVLQTDLADDLPTIVGDRVQLQQVILNLVLNAGEAMRTVDDRPRDLSISTVFDGGDRVRLSVRDVGAGATAEQLAQFFGAFYTTKPEGMGVGLSISRSIVEAHGGRIWADANDGPGLTLSFSLPVTPVS